jgi:hypothetical protein
MRQFPPILPVILIATFKLWTILGVGVAIIAGALLRANPELGLLEGKRDLISRQHRGATATRDTGQLVRVYQSQPIFYNAASERPVAWSTTAFATQNP